MIAKEREGLQSSRRLLARMVVYLPPSTLPVRCTSDLKLFGNFVITQCFLIKNNPKKRAAIINISAIIATPRKFK